MTQIKPVLLSFLTMLIFSCSSETEPEKETEIPKVEYILNYEDEPLVVTDLIAERDGDYFSIHQTNIPENLSLAASAPTFYFHKDGTFLGASIKDFSTNKTLLSPFYFSKDHFEFHIENLDETNKTISVKFIGNVYEHHSYHIYQFNKKLSGTISIPYSESNPLNSKKTYGTTMKVNGKNWRGLGYIWTGYDSPKSHVLKINGDNEYSINIVFPKSTRKIGKYTFNKNSDIYKDYTVNFLRYYPNDIGPNSYHLDPNEFVSTGKLEITEVNASYIIGTFSLTAIDPITNENIVVTDGVFKESHDLD